MAPTLPAAALAVALAAVVACDRPAARAAEDTEGMAIAKGAWIEDPSVLASCDSVAVRWRSVTAAVVTRDDTLIGSDAILPDIVGDSRVSSTPDRKIRACHVVAFLANGIDSTSATRQYWPAKGWGRLWRLSADGPDGQVETFQRGVVRCQVRGEWDGGDDSDSTYVAEPFYRQVTLCWRQDRALVPSDTTLPGAP